MLPVVWFTGLSGSGKSTLSLAVREQLQAKRFSVAILDGDVVRLSISKDLGFSSQDRTENLRRISVAAAQLNGAGHIVLVATISPYRQVREQIRKHHRKFLEVYLDTPLPVCEARDPKGLYKRARAGLLPEFTGVSAPYEPPVNPDILCRTHQEAITVSCARIVNAIERSI